MYLYMYVCIMCIYRYVCIDCIYIGMCVYIYMYAYVCVYRYTVLTDRNTVLTDRNRQKCTNVGTQDTDMLRIVSWYSDCWQGSTWEFM